MQRKNIDKLVNDALAIEAESATKAGTLGFMCRVLTIATMPHKRPREHTFERRNGNVTLTMMAIPSVGLPYGAKPRLLMAWVTTEATRTKRRHLVLGDSLSDFMRQLGLVPTGGRWGTITALREQTKRLFSCAIAAKYESKNAYKAIPRVIADNIDLWWEPTNPDQKSPWTSSVTLSRQFYDEVVSHPVPIDLRALRALSRSPMALDLYIWLTYRMSYLKKETIIPWEALQTQFGANYAPNDQGTRDFKRAFVRQLIKVHAMYNSVRVEEMPAGLLLKPSKTHIRRLPRAR